MSPETETPTEYTPTTDEVREWYAGSVDAYQHETGLPYDAAKSAFDRWLAGERARVLREAADDVRLCWTGNVNLRSPYDPEVAYSIDAWLDVRATRIENGETDD